MPDQGLSEFLSFSGHLQAGTDSVQLDFRARVDQSGEVEFDFAAVPLTRETRFILARWQGEASKLADFSLSGRSDDGTEFRTDDLHFVSLRHQWNRDTGERMTFVGRCSRGTFRRKLLEPTAKPLLRMHLKGFRCYGELHTPCLLGEIAMAGQVSVSQPNVITGQIVLKPGEIVAEPNEWRAQAYELLEYVRRIMSFATASVLRAPIVEFYLGNDLEVMTLSQVHQAPAPMPTVDYPAQQPMFEVAVRSYFDPPIRVNKLLFAIEWFAMDSTYSEVRLVTAMTALETLIDSNLDDKERLLQSRKEFERTRGALRSIIRRCLSKYPIEDDRDEVVVEVNEKLIDLNRRSLLRKLIILAQRWSVPLDGISEDAIKAAKQARDRIVHRGHYYDDDREENEDLWMHVSVVREIIVRFILTVLGYRGQYVSYVGGYRHLQFPPVAEAAKEDPNSNRK